MTQSPASARSAWAPRPRPASRWERREFVPDAARRLQSELNISPFMARLFSARGFNEPAEVDAFLNPALAGIHDPFLFKGMDDAVARIERAIRAGEPICVYGDYDVDGVTATAILKKTFDYLVERMVRAIDVRPYIPHRINEGYGLNKEAVRKLAAGGVKLIITVDNGTTAVEEIALARELGVDVIVTDHHEPGHGTPPALALINPMQAGCGYPFKELCGAGVSFKLAHAILKRIAPDANHAREFLKTLLDYVAVGTVADVVPLRGENRALVAHGMKLLRPAARAGFRALFEMMGANNKNQDSFDLAWTIAPRINSAGRTEHAGLALDLLLSDDITQARRLAMALERMNETRRNIEGDVTAEAFELVKDSDDGPVIVIEREGWHPGVIGIVASRVLERYYRPVIALGVDGDYAKGSARSIKGFNIHSALEACGGMLEQFGGHAMAAGLKIRRDAIANFRSAINDHARSAMRETDLVPKITIDTRADMSDLTPENAKAIRMMAPFGPSNSRPVVELENLTLLEEPRVMKERHLKLRLCGPDGGSFWAVGFSMIDRLKELEAAGRAGLSLVGAMTLNEWGGQPRVEIEIKDFRAGNK